jgi:SAM-dependent methyltransferase
LDEKKTDYSGEYISRYYNEYGMQEWDRLTANPVNLVNLHIHAHYLKEFVPAGGTVLEIGAGPGRFTQILAELGTQITVADISPGQLVLNRQHAEEYGFAAAVNAWDEVDICDLSRYGSESFDRVVVYGGPFSYVLNRRDTALSECLRVLRPGGVLLLSVMSLWGTLHRFLPSALNEIPEEENRKVIESGDLLPETHENRGHYLHMFRSEELRDWLTLSGVEVLAMSASNSLSLTWDEPLAEIQEDETKWAFLLEMEVEACAQPGFLDGGTHLLAVVKKRDQV